MIFGESQAGLLLIVHAILAAALVASTTHLVVWMRHFPRGRFQRIAAIRRFAAISAVLFVVTFVVGNIIYPIYKVRVRAEYLEQATTVVRDYQNRSEARRQVEARYRNDDSAPDLPDSEIAERGAHLPRETARVARWFDVKEHWVAFGMAMSVGCALLVRRWDPRRGGGRAIASIVFLMALSAACTAWFAGIVGLVVTSYRSIGSLGGL